MIKLVRIDHRLLHGQVVFSWSKSLNITRIIIIDTQTANDDFKKMSLNLSKPSDIKLNIFSLDEALNKIKKIEQLKDNIMLIFGNVEEVLLFCKGYPKIEEINFGGITKKENSIQYSNAIFLNESELEASKELKKMGINLYMQQVPTSKKENLNSKLG